MARAENFQQLDRSFTFWLLITARDYDINFRRQY